MENSKNNKFSLKFWWIIVKSSAQAKMAKMFEGLL
jgi:hypothetical protein